MNINKLLTNPKVLMALVGIIGVVAFLVFGGSKSNESSFQIGAGANIGTLDNSVDQSSELDSKVDTSKKNITNNELEQKIKIDNEKVINKLDELNEGL